MQQQTERERRCMHTGARWWYEASNQSCCMWKETACILSLSSLIIQLNGCSSRHYGQLSIINNNMVAVAMGMKTADRTGYVCERERRGGYCALREKLITIHVDHKRAKIRLLMICCCLIKMGESYIIDDAVKRQASRTAIAKLKSRSAR